jgi:DNA-directed RNA polymerase subunit RPC12/RpoP
MNKVLMFVLIFVALGLLAYGAINLIAYDPNNPQYNMNGVIGAVLIIIAIVIFVIVYLDSRKEASRPVIVQQNVNVQMSGSGQLREKKMACRSCGAPIEEKDIKLISGGLMYTCSYCGSTGALEEEPKW